MGRALTDDRKSGAAAHPARAAIRAHLQDLVREAWMGMAGLALLLGPAAAVWLVLHEAGVGAQGLKAGVAGVFVLWIAFLGWHAKRKSALARTLAAIAMPFGEPRGL
jgi:hypothetical protein